MARQHPLFLSIASVSVCACVWKTRLFARESAVSRSLSAHPTGSPKETRVCDRIPRKCVPEFPHSNQNAHTHCCRRCDKESPSNLKFLAFSLIPNVYARHAKRSEWSDRNANCRRQKAKIVVIYKQLSFINWKLENWPFLIARNLIN